MSELDALVGEHVTSETPMVHWEDSHGFFKFDTEQEAKQAIGDRDYQQFLPHVDWENTVPVRVQNHRPYSSDMAAALSVVEKLADGKKQLTLTVRGGQWMAGFDGVAASAARSAEVAICLAALECRGIPVEFSPVSPAIPDELRA